MISCTESELKEIEEMASLMMGPEDIALCMGIDIAVFVEAICIAGNPISKAFYRGSMATDIKLRNSIIKLANQGSSPAQALAIKLRDEFNIKKSKHHL